MKQIGHFIEGENVAGTSGRTADIYNPNTGRGAGRKWLWPMQPKWTRL